MKITREAARRFLLRKQGLLGKKVFSGEEGVLAYIRQAGCIQYDPIDVCGKNADLVLQSRVAGYKPAMLSKLLYEKRRLVDHLDKNMAIYPVEDWPRFMRVRSAYASPHLKSYELVENAAPLVRKKLREFGPSFSGDLQMEGRADWFWSETTIARAVLEALYLRGELCIHHKRGTQKAYDFAENVLTYDIWSSPDPFSSEEAYLDWRIRRRIGGVGLLWNKSSDAYLCVEGKKSPTRNAAFKRLLDRGEICPLEVEGLNEPLYCLSEDAGLVEEKTVENDASMTRVLAPLDNMLWDRRLIEALFDFSYTWEIYTPPAQRKYGYYVLPILQGESFAGRIEMITNRKEKCLEVKHVWPENGKKPDAQSLRACLKEFALSQDIKDVCIITNV